MIFDEVNHTYTHLGETLTPVTTWVNQFVPEFPAEMIAGKTAKRDGVDMQWVLDKWSKKGKLAIDLGNWVHESIEYHLKYDSDFENEPIQAFKEHEGTNPYHSEVIVYDERYAGTIDLIESLGDKKVAIHDFKTNADLEKKNGKLLEPYKDLANTPTNKYRLQLSKYKQLLENMKQVEVVELNLWHYKDHKFEIIKLEPINI